MSFTLCEECASKYDTHLFQGNRKNTTIKFPCDGCRAGWGTAAWFHNGACILQMEMFIMTMKDTIHKLERDNELLRKHIKYMPGGEGALEALESFKKNKE